MPKTFTANAWRKSAFDRPKEDATIQKVIKAQRELAKPPIARSRGISNRRLKLRVW